MYFPPVNYDLLFKIILIFFLIQLFNIFSGFFLAEGIFGWSGLLGLMCKNRLAGFTGWSSGICV